MNELTHIKNAEKLLNAEDHQGYFSELDSFKDHALLGPQVSAIKEEWRKLQIARRNNLMNDEQIHLALKAFHKKSLKQMEGLIDTDGAA